MKPNIANIIDHTLLKPEASKKDIEKLVAEAKRYNFASVCVNPTWVKTASELLKGSSTKVCTVIGFPLGATTAETKAFEAKDAMTKGAQEIDMVMNIGALKERSIDLVTEDIKAVVEATEGQALVKVIIETSLLTDEEKILACEIAVKAGAHFVKTSTGFSTGGATAEDVALMRKTVGKDIGVKASGGVRNIEDLEKMVQAGATRIGTSAGVAIVEGNHDPRGY